jgi:hypothetical protein
MQEHLEALVEQTGVTITKKQEQAVAQDKVGVT